MVIQTYLAQAQHQMANGLDPLMYFALLPIYNLSGWQTRVLKPAACALPTVLYGSDI